MDANSSEGIYSPDVRHWGVLPQFPSLENGDDRKYLFYRTGMRNKSVDSWKVTDTMSGSWLAHGKCRHRYGNRDIPFPEPAKQEATI